MDGLALNHVWLMNMQDGWEPNFRPPMKAFLNTAYFSRYFSWARHLAEAAPLLTPYVFGNVGVFLKEMYVTTPERVRQAVRDHKNGISRDRPSIFTDILAPSLPEHKKTHDRLSGEAFSVTGAGTETTSVSTTFVPFCENTTVWRHSLMLSSNSGHQLLLHTTFSRSHIFKRG